MKHDYYAIHDSDADKRTKEGAKKISLTKAHEYNRKGYGIFWTVNEFDGARKTENLKHINAWFVEMDKLEKEDQLALIETHLIPSLVIESKRGFHVYWYAKDGTLTNWHEIMSRILFTFNGDTNAKDVTRLLRAPGFKHMKDPTDPFDVQVVWENDKIRYDEKDLLFWFKPIPKDPPKHFEPKRINPGYADFWTKLYNFNCAEGLRRFSGKTFVNGEVYEFKPVSRGRLNVFVNGKTTSCFIDEHGRIGSSDKGGPTLWQWLKWYGHSNSTVNSILKQEVPELWT